MTQLVRLINPDTVDHFAAELGHDMEQVVNHARLGTVVLDLQVHGRVHVHGDRFDLSASLWTQPFKEGPYGLSAITLSNPENLLSVGVDHNGGITVALEQGKLVHDQTPYLAAIWLDDLTGKPMVINSFDRMPVQP